MGNTHARTQVGTESPIHMRGSGLGWDLNRVHRGERQEKKPLSHLMPVKKRIESSLRTKMHSLRMSY